MRWFRPREFRHPELVEAEAAHFLDAMRETYGAPLVLTSDARTPEENAAARGSSPTSLHLQGRAFDLQWIPDPEALWRLVDAVYLVAGGPGPQALQLQQLQMLAQMPEAEFQSVAGLFPQEIVQQLQAIRAQFGLGRP